MEKANSPKDIGTMISNLVVRTVMIPYNGTRLDVIIDASLFSWLFFINSYDNWELGWLLHLYILAFALGCIGSRFIKESYDWTLLIPSVIIVVANTFYYQHKIDHRILHDLFPALIYVTLRTKNLFWMVMSLCFFWGQSGFAKAWHGWLDLDTQAAHSHLLFYHLNGFSDQAGWFLSNFPTWLWEIADWSVVVFELSFIAALWSRSLMKVLLPLAVVFHMSVWLMFDINFFFHIPMYLFLFFTVKSE